MIEDELKYLELLDYFTYDGEYKEDRTSTGVIAKFGTRLEFNVETDFPLFTSKKMFFTGVIDELLWFLSGSTNVNDLPARTQHWWTPWASADGGLGPIYGEQYRKQEWKGETYDQLKGVVESLRTNPNSRRHVINLWNSAAMQKANLPCCHGSVIQFYVEQGKLSIQVYQRSVDVFLGLPVNIASYSALLYMVAKCVGLKPFRLIWIGGDTHLYINHLDAANIQLSRVLGSKKMILPTHPKLELTSEPREIDEFTFEDFTLKHYQSLNSIKAPLAV